MKEHWYCAECDVYYGDAECTIVTNAKNLTIPQLADIPQAGDNSSIFMMIAVAIVAATSVTALVITKKRFF